MADWNGIIIFGLLGFYGLSLVFFAIFRKKFAAQLKALGNTGGIWKLITYIFTVLSTLLILFRLSDSFMIALVVTIFAVITVAILWSYYDVFRAIMLQKRKM